MVNEQLEQIMRKEWEDVRKGFHYPQLPQPKLVEDIPNGNINIQSLQISVSEPFITGLGEYNIEEADGLNEVLSHELTHFMKYPGSVFNILKLQKAGREIVDSDKSSELRTAFTEAQTNIYQVLEKKHPHTVRMRKAVQPDKDDSFGRLMYGLYQEVWNQNLGIKLKKQEKKLINRLKDIDFLNKENETSNFKEFIQILKNYQPKKQNNQSQKGNGQCHGNGIGMFSNNQIREGIRQFAQECDNPDEFEEIVKEVLLQGEGQKKKESQPIHGIMPGTDKGITLIAGNFYSALAEKYSIPIRKKPIHKNGSLYPHSHNSFSVGDPLSELDAFSTPGILPGITKKWVRKEGEVATDFETVPNSILIVDNSPSMFDFKKENRGNPIIISPGEKIYHHILGATAISNAYLDNDSKVAVYSFGSNDYFTNLSRNKEQIHRELRRYSSNGGTTFNSQFLENVLRQSEQEFDISIISDMCISNLDGFINTVSRIPKLHRVHLVYTNKEAKSYVDKLKAKFGNQENIAILPLLNENYINKIVMGELTKSIR